jgi:putative membrane protein
LTIRIILVGLMMGAAEVVPGVSGGTIAFVSGFYDRLVHAIQRFSPVRLYELRKLSVPQLWTLLDINFLLLLFGSMFVAILSLARGVGYLLENHPILIWSFFFGLVLASVYSVGRKLQPISIEVILAAVCGVMFGIIVTRIAPIEPDISPLMLFVGGSVAVCAWILPGLSGSFILLILGLYQAVIGAVRDFDIETIAYVAMGCAVGIVSFARLLSMLLDRFHNVTVAILVGFMLGSLGKIWPWQCTVSYQIKEDGSQVPVVQEPVMPEAYYQLTGIDPNLAGALLAGLLGMAVILLLDRFAFLAESEPDWHEDKD